MTRESSSKIIASHAKDSGDQKSQSIQDTFDSFHNALQVLWSLTFYDVCRTIVETMHILHQPCIKFCTSVLKNWNEQCFEQIYT